MSSKNTPTFCPKDRKDWRAWLEKNHHTEQSVWLVCYKAKAEKSNLSWTDAVEEALCFGWIDSIRKTMDEDRFIQYYSRRKPNSIWSRINKQKVDELISKGQMTPAGLACVEVAKENGSWTILDQVESLEVPGDLEKAFSKQKGAKEFYLSLSKSVKKGILFWVIQAKRPKTREKRISEIARLAGQSKLPKQFG